jgi:hypothetical protein
MVRTVLLVMIAVPLVVRAEDEKARRAREELERELSQMVGKQPTKVRLEFVPVDDPNYSLEEASFELDGKPLQVPSLSALSNEPHVLWNGDVSPGKHAIRAKVVYANHSSVIVSDEGGHKWKDVSFDVHSGIEVQVQVAPTHDATQKDVAKRFRLAMPAKPVMIAVLDDGKMPEPAAKLVPPPVAVVEVVDAGAVAVVADKNRPKAAVVIAAAKPNLLPKAPTSETPAREPEPVVAEPVVNQDDAGAGAVEAVVAAAPTELAPSAAPVPEETPWGWIVGGGVALLLAVVVVVSRRAKPPRIDD